MAAPSPRTLSINQIKSNLLNLAQTSVYIVGLTPPPGLNGSDFLKARGINGADINNIELLCCDTNLPGSSLATHDVTNDYPGVTEKFAYRRIYDETIDFTFYVDKSYNVIEYLDAWMNYVTGQETTFTTDQYVDRTTHYRMNYPNSYKTDNLYITKFEKDTSGINMTYQFIGAFPLSITSSPVSYEASNILKCTASFSYMRYIRKRSNRKPDTPLSTAVAGAAVPPPAQAALNGIQGAPTAIGLNSQADLNKWYNDAYTATVGRARQPRETPRGPRD